MKKLIGTALVSLVLASSCAWWQGGGNEVVRAALLDCTTKNATSLTAEFGKLYELAIIKATGGDGKVDWSSVKSTTSNFAINSGQCVANNVIAALLTRKSSASSPQSESLIFDASSLEAGIERGGATKVKTLHGEF